MNSESQMMVLQHQLQQRDVNLIALQQEVSRGSSDMVLVGGGLHSVTLEPQHPVIRILC
jgi:hypothetical protein